MAHPYPQLQIWPNSGAMRAIPWAEYHPNIIGSSDASFGADGVALGMVILTHWSDMPAAAQAILGYTYRVPPSGDPADANPPRTGTIAAASNTAPIVITAPAHGLATGNNVVIMNVGGNLAANSYWQIVVTGPDTFTLNGSAGSAAYTAGGMWTQAGSKLKRVLPWQHPYWNQLWAKRIASVKGIRLEGESVNNPDGQLGFFGQLGGGGDVLNNGPWSVFNLAQITIEFWRPPYFVRSDADIGVDSFGIPREWLRYLDKHWELNTQMLSREGSHFLFSPGQGAGLGNGDKPVPGTVGQKVTHARVKRTWYQIPEAAIFNTQVDKTPNGLPLNFVYTQTLTTNPITGYVQVSGQPIGACVNSPAGGGVNDSFTLPRFLGAYMGTLLLVGIEITPQPLQLPATLMQLPIFVGREPIAQQQYNVTFHFDLFDPARAPNVSTDTSVIAASGAVRNQAIRGHNTMPYAGNSLWYAVQSARDGLSQQAGPSLTPFQYADFNDLFRII